MPSYRSPFDASIGSIIAASRRIRSIWAGRRRARGLEGSIHRATAPGDRAAPGQRRALASDSPGALEHGRPSGLARPRRLAHPAGRGIGARGGAVGRPIRVSLGTGARPAQLWRPFPFFFFSFSFASLLIVCLDGLQNQPH
jgi:hypothetical protein